MILDEITSLRCQKRQSLFSHRRAGRMNCAECFQDQEV